MKLLKSALLGATFLASAGLLASANAADVYSRGGSLKDGPVADYRPAITWTGFYFGAHVGSTLDDTFELSDDVDSLEFEVEENFIAGVHVGYNWQAAGNFVFGIESSWSFLNGDAEVEVEGLELGELEDEWVASVRGRLGYAAGATLLYATGGVAFLETELFEDTATGFVVGGGLEHKLGSSFSIGVEGLYYNFEEDLDVADLELERDFWTIQARLSYHFGGRGYDVLK